MADFMNVLNGHTKKVVVPLKKHCGLLSEDEQQ